MSIDFFSAQILVILQVSIQSKKKIELFNNPVLYVVVVVLIVNFPVNCARLSVSHCSA